MAAPFPFNLDTDKYSRQLWNKAAYLYIAKFFRTAVFDEKTKPVEDATIDDFKGAGAGDDWRLPGLPVVEPDDQYKVLQVNSEGEWVCDYLRACEQSGGSE